MLNLGELSSYGLLGCFSSSDIGQVVLNCSLVIFPLIRSWKFFSTVLLTTSDLSYQSQTLRCSSNRDGAMGIVYSFFSMKTILYVYPGKCQLLGSSMTLHPNLSARSLIQSSSSNDKLYGSLTKALRCTSLQKSGTEGQRQTPA